MWDEEDGFYYDLLRLPDGSATRLKVRSMVGLLPLCATTVIEAVAAGAHPAGDGSDAKERIRPDARTGERPSNPTGPATTLAWRTGGSLPWSTRSDSGGSSKRCSTRTNS